MNTKLERVCRNLLLALAPLTVFAQPVASVSERNEAAAREYVYCGRVTAAWETVSELRGKTDDARGLRAIRTYFVMAATLRSDSEFLKQEVQNSSQRFRQRFSGKDVAAENRDLVSEVDRCMMLWMEEVQPLLGLK